MKRKEINNDLNLKTNYNTYYIFQESSANPSGFYKVNPYIRKESMIISNRNVENTSSDLNLNRF